MNSYVRPYRPADADRLADIHKLAFSTDPVLAKPDWSDSFHSSLAKRLEAGRRIWVIVFEESPVGYARVDPVPGLDGVYDLHGCIIPGMQRQGLGGQLLRHLLNDLREDHGSGGVNQITHAVQSMKSPAAQFLIKSGFSIEHEERILRLSELDQLPLALLPPGYKLGSMVQQAAVRTFLTLYDDAFAGLPWYQPYQNAQEVEADLVDPDDLLFLFHLSQPIGFLWLRWPTTVVAEIEPIGIRPAYQGQGLGRMLLLAGLHQLVGQGAHRITIGAWRENRPAISLYRNLGFRHDHTLTYLAYTLSRL